MLRRQLPASSPIDPRAIVRAAWVALTRRGDMGPVLAASLASRYGAASVVLTDSGTSALILALRASAGRGGTVALPGYCCIDVTAAARFAGVRVRLYDVDPHSLSVDLDSLAGALRRGVDAVVVAHLYGFPADVAAVASLAAAHGLPVIEDAAQGAGGLLDGRLVGSFGDLSILSFGRGKGTTAGSGGVVIAHTADAARRLDACGSADLSAPRRGWRDVATVAAQWALGRPSLYGIPSSIPTLRLGEMVYHAAHEPRELSAAAGVMACRALSLDHAERSVRQRNAARLQSAIPTGGTVEAVRAIGGASPGYLRFPVRCRGRREPLATARGVFPGYPRTLFEQVELRPCLHRDEREQPGAEELRRTLVTLPTHSQLSADDLERLAEWLRSTAGAVSTATPAIVAAPIA